LATARENAAYFEKTLPDLAARYAALPSGAVIDVKEAGKSAAAAFRAFRRALIEIYYEPGSGDDPGRESLKPAVRDGHFAMGASAFAWARQNNLRESRSPSELYAAAEGFVADTTAQLVSVAREIDASRGLGLPFGTPQEQRASLRRILSRLNDDCPKDDAEALDWHRRKGADLVDYAPQEPP